MPQQKLYLYIDEGIASFNSGDEKILTLKELLMQKGIKSRIRMKTPNAKL